MALPAHFRDALRTAPSYHDLRLQFIWNLAVIPEPNAVRFTFTTEWPSAPIVEVFKTRPPRSLAPGVAQPPAVAFLFPLGYGWRLTHAARCAGLEQDAAYWYRIIASGEHPSDRPALAIGQFFTGTREAHIEIDTLFIRRRGDRRTPGEWHHDFGVYDWAKGELLAAVEWPADDYASIPHDNYSVWQPFGAAPIVIPRAPDVLRLYSYAVEDDHGALDGVTFAGLGVPRSMPDAQGHSRRDPSDEASFEWDESFIDVRPATRVGDDRIYLTIDSGAGDLDYTLAGRFRTIVRASARMPRPPVDRERDGLMWSWIGTSAPIGGRGKKKATQFQRGADGQLYWRQRDLADPRRERTAWQRIAGRIAGPVQAVARDDDRVELLTLDPVGGVLFASIATESPTPQWQRLGGTIAGTFATVRVRSGELHIFGCARDGALQHGAVSGKGEPRWRSLGGSGWTSALAAAETDGEIEVFAANERGEIFTRHLAREAAWEKLGRIAGLRALAASSESGRLVLLAFTAERTVHGKTRTGRRWLPAGEKWEALGELDELMDSAPIAGGEAAAKRSPARRKPPKRASRQQ